MKTVLVMAAAGLMFWPPMETGTAGSGSLVPTPVSQDEDFTWKKRMAAGQTLEIKGVNGDVETFITQRSDKRRTRWRSRWSSMLPASPSVPCIRRPGGLARTTSALPAMMAT